MMLANAKDLSLSLSPHPQKSGSSCKVCDLLKSETRDHKPWTFYKSFHSIFSLLRSGSQ